MTDTSITLLRKKEGRGIALKTILLLHSIIAAIMLYTVGWGLFTFIKSPTIEMKLISESSSFVLLGSFISIIIFILIIFTAIALWKWKKIGVYGLTLLFFVWFVEYNIYELPKNLVIAHQTETIPFIIIIQTMWLYLLFALLYFFALKRKWHLFR